MVQDGEGVSFVQGRGDLILLSIFFELYGIIRLISLYGLLIKVRDDI